MPLRPRALEPLLDTVRKSRLYPLLRLRSARRQREEYRALLARIAATPKPLDLAAEVRRQLDALRPQRRPLPATLAEARVLGVGARGWERYGLWPSLQAACDFRLFSDGLPDDAPLFCDTLQARRARGERLLRLVDELQPTLVFLYADSSNLEPELLRRIAATGAWTVLMGLDDKHTFAPFRRGGLTVGVETVTAAADLYWTSWRAGMLLHHALGGRPWLGGAAADPRFHKPAPVPRDLEVLFLGQSYGPRREVVEALRRRGVPVTARGHGWPGGFVGFEQAVELVSRAQIVLGISGVGAMDDVTILKGRDFEAPMCGACYVTQHVDELSDFFRPGEDLLTWSTVDQAAEILLALLRNPPRQERLRRSALATSLARHTWTLRFGELWRVLRGA